MAAGPARQLGVTEEAAAAVERVRREEAATCHRPRLRRETTVVPQRNSALRFAGLAVAAAAHRQPGQMASLNPRVAMVVPDHPVLFPAVQRIMPEAAEAATDMPRAERHILEATAASVAVGEVLETRWRRWPGRSIPEAAEEVDRLKEATK